MNQKILKVSWKEYLTLINKLANLIIKSGKKYKAIYGVPRGGLIPTVILSHKLGIPLHKHTESMQSILKMKFIDREFLKCLNPENTLVVDDIICSGETFKQYKDFDFCTLYSKAQGDAVSYVENLKQSKRTVFVAKYINKDLWVQYPYEEEPILSNRFKLRFSKWNKNRVCKMK